MRILHAFGYWQYDGKGSVLDMNGREICMIPKQGDWEENTRLIVSAPDILDAALRYRAYFESDPNYWYKPSPDASWAVWVALSRLKKVHVELNQSEPVARDVPA